MGWPREPLELARRLCRAVTLIIALGIAAVALARPAAAEDQPIGIDEVARRWDSLDAGQQLAVITQLTQQGAFEQAHDFLARVRKGDAGASLEARFLDGVLHRVQGRYDEAIAVFRALLTNHPELARVRLELAYALYQKQEDESARHHFELVLGAAPDAHLDRTVRGFLEAMDRRRGWHFATYASLGPSTNINQGTDTRTINVNGLIFNVDPASRKQSGIGLFGGAVGGGNIALSDRLDLVAAGGLHARDYRGEIMDTALITGEFGPRYRFGFGEVSLLGTLGHRWVAGDAFGWTHGGKLLARMRLEQAVTFAPAAACQHKQHEIAIWNNGWNCNFSGALDFSVDTRTFFRVLAGAEKEHTARPHLNFVEGSIGVGVHRELTFGVSLYAQAVFAMRDFEGIYPTTTVARHDERVETSLHVTKRDLQIFQMAPSLQYTFTTNASNIAHHSFNGHGVNLTMTRKY